MLTRVILAGALALASATGIAIAQAPNITPSGDPSVKNDTIYRLAVDSAVYPEQATVVLLDDGVVRVESDGRSKKTYRQVTQVLRDRAEASFQEREFSYDADRQKLTINWIRVLKLDGTLISDKPAQKQVSDEPADMVDPVYVHEKVIRESLTGVAPGTLIDISYTLEDRQPSRPGDFYDSWWVSSHTTVRRSRFMVDVPADMALNIREHHLNFARTESTSGHRKMYVWATRDVPWTKAESYAPGGDENDTQMWIAMTAPASWSDVGHWYAGLAHDRLQADSVLRDTVRHVVAKATSHDDSVHAIERWIAQDIRYVSIDLGAGNYQPRMPGKVIATGFGDCKDKATLLIDALGIIGVQAYPVLLNAGGRPDSTLPTIQAFDHEIAAISRGTNAGYQFVDPTSELSRYGTVPYADEGEFALVVHPDGATETVTIPKDSASANLTEVRLTGALNDSGHFSGVQEVHGTGFIETSMRSYWRQQLDSAQRANFLRNAASSIFPNAKGDSLVAFNGKDLTAEARVSLVIRDGTATQRSDNTDILTWHSGADYWSRLADNLQAELPRHMPIDASRVVGPLITQAETRITLPVGWHAHLPTNVTANSIFGTYVSTYAQDGRVLVITRRMTGTTGIFPKERVNDLLDWYHAMAKDNVSFIVIDHGPAAK